MRDRHFLMAGLGLGVALAVSPATGCDEVLEASVAARPDDTDARYALARACALAGLHAEALGHYELLLARVAGNADWLLGKAQALVALGRAREALTPLESARHIAPGYEDVWRANVAALEALDEVDRAQMLAVEAERAFPDSTWPRERRLALGDLLIIRRGTRVSLGVSHEDLSGGRPSWQAVTLDVDWRRDARRRILAGLNVEERFDTQDEQFSVALVDRLSDEWSYSLAAGVAADAQVLPEHNLVAEVDRALPGGRSVNLRARHASYAAVDVDSLAATFEQYADWFRVAYTLTASRPSDLGTHYGHSLRFAHDYDHASQLTLAFAYGEEAETIAPDEVQVTRNRSVAVRGVHWQNAVWGIAWEAGWYEQGDLYDRVRLRLGLEYRL
jgi:YaiO family outer membrane protein